LQREKVTTIRITREEYEVQTSVPLFSWIDWGNHKNPPAEYSISDPKFEPGTYQIRVITTTPRRLVFRELSRSRKRNRSGQQSPSWAGSERDVSGSYCIPRQHPFNILRSAVSGRKTETKW